MGLVEWRASTPWLFPCPHRAGVGSSARFETVLASLTWSDRFMTTGLLMDQPMSFKTKTINRAYKRFSRKVCTLVFRGARLPEVYSIST